MNDFNAHVDGWSARVSHWLACYSQEDVERRRP
jgi:hypothetical protein